MSLTISLGLDGHFALTTSQGDSAVLRNVQMTNPLRVLENLLRSAGAGAGTGTPNFTCEATLQQRVTHHEAHGFYPSEQCPLCIASGSAARLRYARLEQTLRAAPSASPSTARTSRRILPAKPTAASLGF